jgi:RimJ/RimL family protein N-acetyltransferase
MEHRIIPAHEGHVRGVYEAFDAVAREERYLASTDAPAYEKAFPFFKNLLDADSPFFVALDGERVVGWCDIATPRPQSQQHLGELGMGLLPQARGRGLGSRLLRAAIDKAWQNGLTRVELTVRDDNTVARALYARFGFEVEGVLRRASVIRDEVNDVLVMGLLRDPA